jgi:hypothetical protein
VAAPPLRPVFFIPKLCPCLQLFAANPQYSPSSDGKFQTIRAGVFFGQQMLTDFMIKKLNPTSKSNGLLSGQELLLPV